MTDEKGKCKHSACVCAAKDDGYCSEYCKEARRQDITEITCGCEHQGCAMT